MEKIVAFRCMGDISSEGTYNSEYPCCSWGSLPKSLIFYNLCNLPNQADFLIRSTYPKEGGLIA
jgi:hypothetical protein